jgi:hypothetical protein
MSSCGGQDSSVQDRMRAGLSSSGGQDCGLPAQEKTRAVAERFRTGQDESSGCAVQDRTRREQWLSSSGQDKTRAVAEQFRTGQDESSG